MTAAELFLRDPESDAIAAHFEDRSYTRRELVAESRRRAAWWERVRDPAAPPHIGVLLDNTRRVPLLARRRRDHPLGGRRHQRDLPRRRAGAADRPHRLPGARDLRRVRRPPRRGTEPGRPTIASSSPGPTSYRDAAGLGRRRPPGNRRRSTTTSTSSIFTSGTTGLPKAVRCTQGRFARTGKHVASVAGLGPGSAVYAPLPVLPHQLPVHRAGERARGAGADRDTRRSSRRRAPCPTSVASASTMLAYTGQGPQLHPRGAAVARRRRRRRSCSRSATRRRSPTSATSPRGSTARCATATARPRA